MKSLRWMTVFALVAGLSVFAGCSSDDDNSGGNGGSNNTAGTGGSSNGGSANGGSSNGGSANGGSANGGSANGGSANGGSANGGSANGGSANGGSANGGSANGGSANGGAAGDDCAQKSTKAECNSCCMTAYPAAGKKFLGYAAACVCQDGQGYCKTECASTLCASTPTEPDATCQACMEKALYSTCTDALSKCSNDNDCSPVLGCLTGCAGKQ